MRARILVVLLAGSAGAQESAPSMICEDIAIDFAKPAVAEWTSWIGAGGEILPGGEGRFAARAGVGVDFGVATFGTEERQGKRHVRVGPWLGGETTFDGDGLVEGGFSTSLGRALHAEWGTWTLRAGAGVEREPTSWRPEGSATLTWGALSVAARYSEGGGCVEPDHRHVRVTSVGAPRSANGYGTGWRIFATGRVDGATGVAMIFGLEIEPTLLLPPYTLGRLIGDPRP